MVQERRISKRTKAIFPITINYQKLDYKTSLIGETVNISDSGACLVLDRALPVESDIHLKIDIPQNYSFVIPDETGNIETDAKIIWINQLKEPHRYRFGVKFNNKKNEFISALNNVIQDEEKSLVTRDWKISHPKISQPTVPISHNLLKGLSPTSLSVDLTNLCNLRCKHCFWETYDMYIHTGTNEGIINQVKIVLEKFPTITNITWYGGEPLLNTKTLALLEEGIKLKKNNLIITNGTMPIPCWHINVHFAVSIDGIKEIHDQIRGQGVYDRLKHNVMIAVNQGIPIAFLYCINALNIDCIPDFLDEWAFTKHIGIVFTVYVPLKGKPNDLGINNEQRKKIVSLLMKMKDKHGEAICNTKLMIKLIGTEYGKELMENCPMNVFNRCGRVHCLHMCNDGTIRIPCAIGTDADHFECRSVTKLALYAGTVLRDRKSFLSLLRMYLSKPHNKDKTHVISFGK